MFEASSTKQGERIGNLDLWRVAVNLKLDGLANEVKEKVEEGQRRTLLIFGFGQACFMVIFSAFLTWWLR